MTKVQLRALRYVAQHQTPDESEPVNVPSLSLATLRTLRNRGFLITERGWYEQVRLTEKGRELLSHYG